LEGLSISKGGTYGISCEVEGGHSMADPAPDQEVGAGDRPDVCLVV